MSLNKTPECVPAPKECPGAPKKPGKRRRVQRASSDVVEIVREVRDLKIGTPKKPTLATTGLYTAATKLYLGVPLATSTPKKKRRRRTRSPSPQDIFA